MVARRRCSHAAAGNSRRDEGLAGVGDHRETRGGRRKQGTREEERSVINQTGDAHLVHHLDGGDFDPNGLKRRSVNAWLVVASRACRVGPVNSREVPLGF